ncbi:hypothetical protein SAMN04487939_10652 [Lysobacter sp. yr284]|nr:hypothetical protein SAMN04487939_10652 [Lysobacter sp. yr284]
MRTVRVRDASFAPRPYRSACNGPRSLGLRGRCACAYQATLRCCTRRGLTSFTPALPRMRWRAFIASASEA